MPAWTIAPKGIPATQASITLPKTQTYQGLEHTLATPINPTPSAAGGKLLNSLSKTKKGGFISNNYTPGPGAYVNNTTVPTSYSSGDQRPHSKANTTTIPSNTEMRQARECILPPTITEPDFQILNTQLAEDLSPQAQF